MTTTIDERIANLDAIIAATGAKWAIDEARILTFAKAHNKLKSPVKSGDPDVVGTLSYYEKRCLTSWRHNGGQAMASAKAVAYSKYGAKGSQKAKDLTKSHIK